MSTAFSNVFIETDKQVATHLLFVYWFGLQNMRHHICSRAIKQHRDCFWVSTTLILQLAEETTDAKDAWKREPNGSQNVYIFIQNPPKTPYEVHFEKYFSKKRILKCPNLFQDVTISKFQFQQKINNCRFLNLYNCVVISLEYESEF